MKPILYKANETTFETYGLGEIDATKALVTRERNGNYTLYIEYPASGRLASVFKNDMRIKSDAGLRTKNQTFYISRIVKSSKSIIKIYAKHISHLTEFMAIRNKTLVNGTASSALSIWASNTLGGVRFDTWSDITTSNQTSWDIANVKNAREALGGREGSILDVWGGEFEFDNTTIRLHKQLGRKSPIVLEYGRNILSAEDEQDIEATYTSIYPYATYTPESTGSTDGRTEAITVELPEKYIDSKYVGLYNERRVEIVDFSSSFKEKEVPTAEKLKSLANAYIINNNVGLPKINTKIEYVDLSKAQDHASNQILEEAELCDIVPIYYPPIGITSEDGKLTTIVFDVLRGVNDSVEVGTIGEGIRSAMTSGLATQVSDIAKSQKQLVDTLPKYLLNAQGNKVWYNRPDANIEHKVGDIWFEKNGLYDRMYIWNGSMWEKRIDTEDVDKVKKEVDKQLEEANKLTAIEIEKANAKAQEALIKAGTIPDASKLSEQIKTLILNSPDLNQKVTESLNQTDSGVIYNKIYQNIKQDFVVSDEISPVLAGINQKLESQTVEFQKLTETNKLYERIIGTSETDAPDKLSRLVMSSEIFQTEVGKYAKDDFNLVYDPTNFSKWKKKQSEANVVEVQASTRLLRITNSGNSNNVYRGFALPITTSSFTKDEKLSYRIEAWVDVLPDAPLGIELWNDNSVIASDRVTFTKTGTQIITGTMTVNKTTTKSREFPLEFWLLKNGTVAIGKVSLIRGDRPPKKFTDNTSTQDVATQTQVSQLAGSWSVKNLNSNGDVLNSINVLANGTNRIDGRLTHITGQTKIDNAVIKDGMIASLTADKITGGTIDASQVNVININASNVNAGVLQGLVFRGGRIESLDGTLAMDLNNKKIRLNGDNVGIVREFKGYPTQFIRYEASIENGHKHAKTIIGSNRNGTESWNSPSFSGIVIDNNANNSLDNIYQFGDHIHFKHSQGDDGWRFSNVSQIITPGVWNKNSEIWARAFVIPKETKGATDTPTKFINLVDSVAALWKLWAHAKGQVSMTGAMQTVIQGSLDAWSYSRPHI